MQAASGFSQGAKIGITGSSPHSSAILELETDSKGLLIPRLSSSQRLGITPIATGLMVYDTDEASFWYYNGSSWAEVGPGQVDEIRDSDGNTSIQVEEGTNDDIIRFDIAGGERLRLQQNANNQTLLQLNLGQTNAFVGESAGLAITSGGYNSFLGQFAGSNTSTGHSNSFLGYQAGNANVGGHSNLFLGRAAGLSNTDGQNNVFIGRGAGFDNTDGDRNIFVSRNAGFNNDGGNNNLAIGYSAGYSNVSGSGNIFLGYEAGYNETGSNRFYLDNSNTNTPLLYGELDNDLLRVYGEFNINDEYSFPMTDGSPDQVLGTDGAGNLGWQDIADIGGGGSVEIRNERDDAGMAALGYCYVGELSPDLETYWKDIDSVGPNVPNSMSNHAAFWVNEQMWVWGGPSVGQSGMYDPLTDSWSAVSLTNSPSSRFGYSAILAGDKVIIWGGFNGATYYNDGRIYDPVADSWTSISTTNAPIARSHHSAIWTGTHMIIWGGRTGFNGELNTGASYHLATDTWTSISAVGVPDARAEHSAIWTGTEMIVWGGLGPLAFGEPFATGGKYNPSTNSWTSMASPGLSQGRTQHDAFWTGSKMLIWEGRDQDLYFNPTGKLYDPVQDLWCPMADGGFDDEVKIEAVWTGSELLAFGEHETGDEAFGSYDFQADTWTQPMPRWRYHPRIGHSMVWADGKMIIWGGQSSGNNFNSGGIFFNPSMHLYLKL
ncbi:MAG: hypothetical protein AAF587_35620 [Bacteroidota bacterium]